MRVFISLALAASLITSPAFAGSGHPKGHPQCYVPVSKTSQAQTTDTGVEQRRAAAERYLNAVEYDSMLDGFVSSFVTSTGAPPDAEDAANTFLQAVDMKAVEEILINQMVANFTLNELNAMADFQESPEGQSINKKMPDFMGDLIQAAIPVVFQAIMNAGALQPPQNTPPADAQPEEETGDGLPH